MSTKEIPHHELPADEITIHSGIGCECPNGSILEIWNVKEHDGFHIKLRRKIDDETISVLKFGISREAAAGLCGMIQAKLYPEEFKLP